MGPQAATKDIAVPGLSDAVHIESVSLPTGQHLYFVLDPSVPSWGIVNSDGVELLQLCDGERTSADIAKEISRRKNIEYPDALQLADTFLEQMQQQRILYADNPQEKKENTFHGVALEITRQCNLRCRHCYLAAGKEAEGELSGGEIKKFITSVKEEGGISIAIGGGEPLLRADCLELVDHALSCGLLVSLGTNATLIDGDVALRLAALPIKIQISLDGATEAVHDGIRGSGSYRRAANGIDELVRAGKADDMVIAFTAMKKNVHEVTAIVQFAYDRGIPVVQFPPLTPAGRARNNWDDLRLSSDELVEFWQTISQCALEVQGEMDLLADCFSMNIHQAGKPYQCSIGSQYRIDPAGNVYPCQCFHYGKEYLLGNIRRHSLKSMVEGGRIKEIQNLSRKRSSMIDACSDCKWMNYCGSGCMGNAFETTGSVLQPTACRARKQWIESLCAGEVAKAVKGSQVGRA
ncbi:MAG TPA: radical SAM protein [Desulfobulbus sp.]|nr:radical SAM protein [Desulfobulbus sp.]